MRTCGQELCRAYLPADIFLRVDFADHTNQEIYDICPPKYADHELRMYLICLVSAKEGPLKERILTSTEDVHGPAVVGLTMSPCFSTITMTFYALPGIFIETAVRTIGF